MAETYKKIFPGNAVAHLSPYALPNPDFAANSRASGDARDRNHMALMFCPGWLAVRKLGYAHIEAGATEWDITVPSPYQRASEKPMADINGLYIPSGAIVHRVGFRVEALSAQPGSLTAGHRQDSSQLGTGLVGTATDLLALSSAAIAASAAGSIAATAIRTASNGTAKVVVDADGKVPQGVEVVSTAFGSPVITTADMTLKLYSIATAGNAPGSAISAELDGGCYVTCFAEYLVREAAPQLSDFVGLPGAVTAGTRG